MKCQIVVYQMQNAGRGQSCDDRNAKSGIFMKFDRAI